MELQLDLTKRYTFADYITWFDDVRRELFDGLVKLMSPAPTSEHQSISSELHITFGQYLRRKKCKIFSAPFDVRLPESKTETSDKQIYTVVQPDICIICDVSKIEKRGCLGAPDLIVEIVSESNSKRDVEEKFELYQRHGVREYWIVLPSPKIINVFLLNEKGKYEIVGMYAEDSKVPVNIFNGEFAVDLKEIFID